MRTFLLPMYTKQFGINFVNLDGILKGRKNNSNVSENTLKNICF